MISASWPLREVLETSGNRSNEHLGNMIGESRVNNMIGLVWKWGPPKSISSSSFSLAIFWGMCPDSFAAQGSAWSLDWKEQGCSYSMGKWQPHRRDQVGSTEGSCSPIHGHYKDRFKCRYTYTYHIYIIIYIFTYHTSTINPIVFKPTT